MFCHKQAHGTHQYLPDIKLEVKSIINTTTNSQTPHKTDILLSKQAKAQQQLKQVFCYDLKVNKFKVQGAKFRSKARLWVMSPGRRLDGMLQWILVLERWTLIQQFELCTWKPTVKQHPEINYQQSRLQVIPALERYLSPRGILHGQTAEFSKRNSSSLT